MENQSYGQPPVKRLTTEEKNDPLLVFQQVYDCYHLHELKEQLSEWLHATLKADNTPYSDSLNRSNLLFLHENLERMAEASFLLKIMQEQKN